MLKTARRIFLLSRALSRGSFFLFSVILIKLYTLLFLRVFFRNTMTVRLPLEINGTRTSFSIRSSADIAALAEIYVEHEYDLEHVGDATVILDIGAHIGDTALYFAARYPKALIIAAEPSSENISYLKENTKSFEQIKIFEGAVGDSDGVVIFYSSSSSLSGSKNKRDVSTKAIKVPQISISSLLKMHGRARADIIKFDIEGGEDDLFELIAPEDVADQYIGEIHLDLMARPLTYFIEKFAAFNVSFQELVPGRRYLLRAQLRTGEREK